LHRFEAALKKKSRRTILIAHNPKQKMLLSFNERQDLFGRFGPDYSLSFGGDL